jgi:hypothetical protein
MQDAVISSVEDGTRQEEEGEKTLLILKTPWL